MKRKRLKFKPFYFLRAGVIFTNNPGHSTRTCIRNRILLLIFFSTTSLFILAGCHCTSVWHQRGKNILVERTEIFWAGPRAHKQLPDHWSSQVKDLHPQNAAYVKAISSNRKDYNLFVANLEYDTNNKSWSEGRQHGFVFIKIKW